MSEAHGGKPPNVCRRDISTTLSQVIQCRVDVPVTMAATYRCVGPSSAQLAESCAPVSDRDPHVARFEPTSVVTLTHSATALAVNLIPHGFIAFRIESCSGNVCDVILPRLHIALPDFELAGQQFSHVAIGFSEDVHGSLIDDREFRVRTRPSCKRFEVESPASRSTERGPPLQPLP